MYHNYTFWQSDRFALSPAYLLSLIAHGINGNFFFLHPKRTTFQCGNSRHWLKLWEIRKTRSKNEKLFI